MTKTGRLGGQLQKKRFVWHGIKIQTIKPSQYDKDGELWLYPHNYKCPHKAPEGIAGPGSLYAGSFTLLTAETASPGDQLDHHLHCSATETPGTAQGLWSH